MPVRDPQSEMSVALVTPFAPGDLAREQARKYVEAWYERRHGLPTYYGTCAEPWRKGVALEDGLRGVDRDGGAAVLVLADADVLVSATSLNLALNAVRDGAPWAMPHSTVYRLSRRGTMLLYGGEPFTAGPPPTHWLERRAHPAPPGGGIVVVPRETYDLVGGIDARFVGWGGEDISFARALDTLAGQGYRGNAPMWHLWHRPQLTRRQGSRGSPANEALAARYMLAAGDLAAMEVLAGECVRDRAAAADG